MNIKREDIKCPYCSQMTGRKQGTIPSVTSGKKQRYSCRECGRTWY